MMRKTKDVLKAVEMIVMNDGKTWKWSYRLNILILLSTILKEAGWPVERLKSLRKAIDLKLLWEDPDKARLLSDVEVRRLLMEPVQRWAVVNALMLPVGMRFADSARIRAMDAATSSTGLLTLRIRQAKNIRSRKHQRWLQMQVPPTLLRHIMDRLKQARPEHPLVTVTYNQYLQYLKRTLSPSVSTYSLRLTSLNAMAAKVRTIEELQRVTFHRSAEQLRWYLNQPLRDDANLQIQTSQWCSDIPGPFSLQ